MTKLAEVWVKFSFAQIDKVRDFQIYERQNGEYVLLAACIESLLFYQKFKIKEKESIDLA